MRDPLLQELPNGVMLFLGRVSGPFFPVSTKEVNTYLK